MATLAFTITGWKKTKKTTPQEGYEVFAPNCVRHIDTNHKNIRWNLLFMVALMGSVDLFFYMKCVGYNKAITDLTVLQKLCADMVNPSNYVLIKGCYLKLLDTYYRIDAVLQQEQAHTISEQNNGLLDPLKEVHIFALHYIVLPMINTNMAIWKDAQANHRLRTVRSSPKLLLIAVAINTKANFQDRPASIYFNCSRNR